MFIFSRYKNMFKKAPQNGNNIENQKVSGSDIENSKANWLVATWKKLFTTACIVLALWWAAKETNAATPVNNSETTSNFIPNNPEATNAAIFDDFSRWDFEANNIVSDSTENSRSLEAVAKKYVNDNVYFNWKKISELWAKIEKNEVNESSVKCSAEFDYELNNWETSDWKVTAKLDFFIEFKDGKISLSCKDYWFKIWDRIYKDNIVSENWNIYDVGGTFDWKTCNFVVAYNKFRTWEFTRSKVQKPTLGNRNAFPESVPELKKLNICMKLWTEVHKEGDVYTRDLYWDMWWKYIKILSIPFDKDGNTDWTEITTEILGKTVHILVDKWLNVSMPEEDQDVLVEKINKDKEALTHLFDNQTDPSPEGYFSWLKTVVNNWEWWINKDNINLANPKKWGYTIKINDYPGNNLLFFKLDWNWNISVTDANFNVVSQYYLNFNKNSRFQVSYEWGKLCIGEKRRPWENPQEYLTFSWDKDAINLLNKATLISNSNGVFGFHDENGDIGYIPVEKDSDWTLKLKEGLTVQLNALNLYRYKWYNSMTSQISALSKELWIPDIYILDVFEQGLKNNWVSFTLNGRELQDTENLLSMYFEVSQKGDDIDFSKSGVYSKWEIVLKTILERMTYLKKVKSSRLLKLTGWKNLKPQYEDYTNYNGWKDGVWFSEPTAQNEHDNLENGANIIRKIRYWDWKSEDIIFDGWKPRIANENATIKIGSNEFKVEIDNDWNVILKVIKL